MNCDPYLVPERLHFVKRPDSMRAHPNLVSHPQATRISSSPQTKSSCWSWVGLYLVIVGLLAGCSPGGPPPFKMPPPKVIVAQPLKQTVVEWDQYVGRVEPVEAVDIRARVSGYLLSTHFDEGQIAKAGDLLAVIDPRPFEADAKKAEADRAQAVAKLATAKAGIVQAEAELAAAAVRLELTKRTVARYRELAERKSVSQEDVDVKESDYSEAIAKRDAAVAKVGSVKADASSAEAAIETASAQVTQAKLNLSYTRVISPITGRVGRRLVTEGNLISGGSAESTLLTTVVSLDPIHCYFDADEQAFLKYSRLSREGTRKSSREYRNPVYLSLADEQGQFPHKGHMDFVDNRLDRQTGTIRGRAIFSNADFALTPGLFARVRIPGSGSYEAVLIPDAAVETDQSDKFVYVVDDTATAHRKTVTLGPIVSGLRVIRSGLTGDEKIIIRGGQKVAPESKVNPEAGEIKAQENSLPNDYTPVPESEWIKAPRPDLKKLAPAKESQGNPQPDAPANTEGVSP